jgi:tripartite-type tricarboxylate transporter receptor subunit TctC
MSLPRFAAILTGVTIITGTAAVCAQSYPSKPIRIVTAAAGGGNDFQSRIIAPVISAALGQQVLVENRTGPIAAEIVAKSPPDGYTLHVAGGALWLTPLLQKAPYDVVRDFTPITMTVREMFILAVHPSLPVKSVKELVALAKARPGELNYASDATGSRSHLSTEIFKSMAGANVVRIAYKGGAAATAALISGEVQMAIFDAAILLAHAKTGKLRALAVTSAEPSALVPGLPTLSASGLPGYDSVGMTGFFAPIRTPAAIITRLHQEIVRALNSADVRERFTSAGLEIIASTPEQLAAAVQADVSNLVKAIKAAGIKPDF